MMTAAAKPSIRIIKRKERELLAGQSVAPANHLKTENQSRRELVQTIASWIEKRREMMKGFPRSKGSVF